MKAHEIFENQDKQIKKLVQLDIKNIEKEWDTFFKTKGENFTLEDFDEFWSSAGYQKSAFEELKRLAGENKITLPADGTWNVNEQAGAPTPSEYFKNPKNFKDFVNSVVQTAADSNPDLFIRRIKKNASDRSWWELIGYNSKAASDYADSYSSGPSRSSGELNFGDIEQREMKNILNKLYKDEDKLSALGLTDIEKRKLSRLQQTIRRS